MHPLVDDLSEIRDDDLSDRISDLTKKYFMIPNPDVKFQIQSILEMYQDEYNRRRQRELEDAVTRLGKSVDDLIKVG